MAPDHAADIAAFDQRAEGHESGGVGRWHAKVVERSADVALAAMPVPLRVLDVGCGTGALLREMVVRVPYGEAYVGVDPAPAMLAMARRLSDPRIEFVRGVAESLPFPDAAFDLVITSTSFDHWADQRAGLTELGRVVSDNGRVVVVDLSAAWLRSHGRARSPRRMLELLGEAGLRLERRETIYRLGYTVPLIRAFIASL